MAANAAAPHEYHLGALEIGHPYAVETPPAPPAGAGYLSVTNTGSTPDRLLAIRTEFPPRPRSTLWKTDAAGVTRMRPVEALDIPPGATVVLAPQGLHVMFMGLGGPLVSGTSIPATLVFEEAGEIPVEFKVEPRTAGAMHDMPGMDH